MTDTSLTLAQFFQIPFSQRTVDDVLRLSLPDDCALSDFKAFLHYIPPPPVEDCKKLLRKHYYSYQWVKRSLS